MYKPCFQLEYIMEERLTIFTIEMLFFFNLIRL